MGYITIDLLGKDSVDGGKQIASTSALPARTDTATDLWNMTAAPGKV
jgi:hypothetical protein